jgi:hypothetical protein
MPPDMMRTTGSPPDGANGLVVRHDAQLSF